LFRHKVKYFKHNERGLMLKLIEKGDVTHVDKGMRKLGKMEVTDCF